MKIEGDYNGCHTSTVDENCMFNGNSFQTSPLDGLSIVLADDEFINQYMISSFLEEQGAMVTICENGLELLRVFEKSRPDMILTDISMPVMDGLEATRKIRESERCHDKGHIPIIAMTAHGSKGYDATCFLAGMDEYFTKPIDLDSMTTVILNLCCKRKEYA